MGLSDNLLKEAESGNYDINQQDSDRNPITVNTNPNSLPTHQNNNPPSAVAEKLRSREIFKMMGEDLDESAKAQSLAERQALVKQVYADAEKNAPFLEKVAKGIDRMDNNVVTKTAKDTVGAVVNTSAGIMLGASKAFWSGINAFKEGYNAIGKMAEDHKMIEKFDPAVPVDMSGFIDKNYPESSKFVADMGQALSPAGMTAAAVAAGAGPITAVAAAAASTYMLMDPKQAGLAELAKYTAVGKTLMLEEAFGEAFKYSAKKPEDTAIEGRLKNVLDYAFGESLIGGVFASIRTIYNSGRKVAPFIRGAEKAVEDAPKVIEAAPKAAEVVPPAQAVDGVPTVVPTPEVAPIATPSVVKPAEEASGQLSLEEWAKALDPHNPEAYIPQLDQDPMARMPTPVPQSLDRTRALEGPTNINPGIVDPKALVMPVEDTPFNPGALNIDPNEKGITQVASGPKGILRIEAGVTNSTNLDFRGRKQIMNPVVKAYYISESGKKILVGRILIQGEVQDGKLVYSSGMSYVRPEFRKLGVATRMYDYADKNMALIKPSKYQSEYGKAFWSTRNQKIAESIIENNPEVYGKRPPQTIPGMIEEATKRQSDPNWFRDLLESRKGDPTQPLSAEDSLALDLEGLSADARAKGLSEKALTTGAPLDIMAANEALDHTIKILSIKEAVASEAGRTLGITEGLARAVGEGTSEEAAKKGLEILGSKGRAKLLQSYMNAYGGSRPMVERLHMLDMIRQIPNEQFADEALKAGNNITKVVAQTGFRKLMDAAYHTYVGSLLTIKTPQAVYLMNQAVSAMAVMDKYMSIAISKIPLIGSGRASIEEANAYAYGMLSSQWAGHKAGIKALVMGKNPNGLMIHGNYEKLAVTEEAAASNSVWGKLFEKGIQVSTVMNRLTMSADAVSKYINESAFLRAAALREANTMAAKVGVAAIDKPAYIDNFVTQFMEKPPIEHAREAMQNGTKLTMNGNISDVPLLGEFSDALQTRMFGVGRFAFPFLNVGVNAAKYGMEYVPGLNFAVGSVREAFKKGGAARDEAIAKMVNGSIFGSAVYNLYQNGNLTGELPNYKQQTALADGGKGLTPYTLDLTEYGLGAHYIRSFDPLTRALKMGALFGQAFNSSQDTDAMDQMAFVFAGAMSQLTPEQMDGYYNFADALMDAKKGDNKALSKWVANLGANLVPLNGTRKQLFNVLEAYHNEDMMHAKQDETYRGFMDYFKGKLGQGVGFGFAPKLDIFGEPIKEHWLSAVTPFHSVDVENSATGKYLRKLTDFTGELERQGFKTGFTIEMPSDSISDNPDKFLNDMGFMQLQSAASVKLTTDEYYDMIKNMNTIELPGPGGKPMVLKDAVEVFAKNDMKTYANQVGGFKEAYTSKTEQTLAELQYKDSMNNFEAIFRKYEAAAKKMTLTNPDIQLRLKKERDKNKLSMPGFSTPFGGN